jgi:plastocyanin
MRRASLCLLASLSALIFTMPSASAETYTVTIKDFVYKPSSLTVNKGDTVKFVNEDDAPHTVTPFRDAHFKPIDKLGKGESGTITFEQSGRQKYYCDIHPMMEGSVVVK